MNDIIAPLVRRAILDLLNDTGGEINDDVLSMLLASLGHRVARRDVAEQLHWLADSTARGGQLVHVEEIGSFLVARILQDGRDVSDGKLRLDGIHRFKTGE